MEVTKQEARKIITGEHPEFKIVKIRTDDTDRWSTYKTGIFEHEREDWDVNPYFRLQWKEGSTEEQYERPFEYTEPKLVRVYKTNVVETKFLSESEKEKNYEFIEEPSLTNYRKKD